METKTSINELPDDDWETRYSKQVFRNIAYYKESMGLSTPELASRVSQVLGEEGALKSTTLNNMLAGKRKAITVPEVFAFARAMGVPPIALMVPILSKEVELFPGKRMIPADAVEAITGEVVHSLYPPDEIDDEPRWTRHVLDLLSTVRRTENTLRDEFLVLGHRLVHPENYKLPQAILDEHLQRLIFLAADAREAVATAESTGVVVAPPRDDIEWLIRVRPDEITPLAIKEAWLDAYANSAMDVVESLHLKREGPDESPA